VLEVVLVNAFLVHGTPMKTLHHRYIMYWSSKEVPRHVFWVLVPFLNHLNHNLLN